MFYRDYDWLYNKYVNEGLTLKEIAELCECSYETISRHIKKFSITKQYKNKNWLESEYKTKSIKQIALDQKTSERTISKHIKEFGLEKVKPALDVKEIKILYEAHTAKEIANMMNVSHNTIILFLSKNNIKKKAQKIPFYYEEKFLRNELKSKSISQVAKEYNISKNSISRRIKKLNIKIEKQKKKCEDYEWLYEHFIKKELTLADIAKLSACSTYMVRARLKKFNLHRSIISQKEIKKNSMRKQAQTNIERYGFKSPAQNKKIYDKIRKTNLIKYGYEVSTQNKDVKAKVEATNIKKWGTKCTLQNIDVKEKTEQTNLKKYGFKFPVQHEIIKQKIRNTNIKKYGVSCSLQSEENITEMMRRGRLINYFGKNINEWANLYNYSRYIPYLIKRKFSPKTEEEFIQLLNQYKKSKSLLEFYVENFLELKLFNKKANQDLPYRPDFKLTKNIFLNVDGLYWHSELNKEKMYHFDMRKRYEVNKLRIIQIREDELYKKSKIIKSILSHIQNKTEIKIFARKTSANIVSSKIAIPFLNENHLMGQIKSKHLGLYFEDQLVSILSFKIIKNNLKIERFCSKLNVSVVGGFSKLLHNLSLTKNFNNVLYWADLRYGTGDYLKQLGFKKERDTLGWKWTDLRKTYNRLRCRANMDARNLSQAEYANELNWVKIYDAGQRLWVK